MDIQTVKDLSVVIVAVITLCGTVFTATHAKPFEDIKTLSETLKTLTEAKEKLGLNNFPTELNDAIRNLSERLKYESNELLPYPKYLGLGISCIGIILFGVTSFIPDPYMGLCVLIVAVVFLCAGFWFIPRCKK